MSNNVMSENLKQKLREYLEAKSKGTVDENEFIIVTRDTKLSSLLPSGQIGQSDIETIFNRIVNEYNQLLQTPPTAPIEAPIEAPASAPIEVPINTPPTAPLEPRVDKRPSEMIAEVRNNVLYPNSNNEGRMSQQGAEAIQAPAKAMTMTLSNPDVPIKKINQIGYANIVLMSIIVIIIVAIICVFIFL